MTPPALLVERLTKVFRARAGLFGRGAPRIVVDAVDLRVEPGELFVLLGRNGAGKTTLVKMLATLVLPTSGRAALFGHDLERDEARVRSLVGLASTDERSFFWRLSGRQNLEFFAALHGLHGRGRAERIAWVVERAALGEFVERRFDAYSSGMKQRMALARSLLGDPRLLFLDEPTRSLDPAAQKETRALVRRLAREGMTIVLVTHQLDEARELGGRTGFMDRGRLTTFAPGAADLDALFA